MTETQRIKCNKIIEGYKYTELDQHTISVAKSVLGISIDISNISSMVIDLAKVFYLSVSEAEACGFVVAALNKMVLEKPTQAFIMEKAKNLPIIKRLVHASMLQTLGWKIMHDLDKKILFEIQSIK